MKNILLKDNNTIVSPKEQLGLFSEDNKTYIQSIQKSIGDFLSGDNLIFSDKNTKLYLTEKNIKGDIIDTVIVCNIIINEKQVYFQLKCIVDTLKKYVYCEYKGKKAKQIEGLKVNLPFMSHLQDFIGNIINDKDIKVEDYKYTIKKPKDIVNKQIKNKEIEYPYLDFTNSSFEKKEDNKIVFFFTLNNTEFRITNVEVFTINQNNGNNDNSELNTFNKHCLYNIGMKIGEKREKFNYKDLKIEKYIRDKISTHIFNIINSYEFKKLPEEVN